MKKYIKCVEYNKGKAQSRKYKYEESRTYVKNSVGLISILSVLGPTEVRR